MAAKDFLHDFVKTALVKDGWIITHDPFTIAYGQRKVYADLAAEQVFLAEKGTTRIVVEIKSFLSRSKISDLEQAIGQYTIYRLWLSQTNPEYTLYLAIDQETYNEVFVDLSGRIVLEQGGIKVIVVDKETLEVVRWIN